MILSDLYVPVDSSESALATLSTSLRAGCSLVLVSGPKGMGKTLLLQRLAKHEREAFPDIRYTAWLPPLADDLAGYLLYLLFGRLPPRGKRATEAALRQSLLESSDGRRLLLVDDIQRASEGSVRKLAELVRAAKPGLSLVVAGTGLEDLPALTDVLAANFSVLLPESLSELELAAIYDAVLDSVPDDLRARLADLDRDELLRAAEGRPGGLMRELARGDRSKQLVPSEPEPTPVDAPTEPLADPLPPPPPEPAFEPVAAPPLEPMPMPEPPPLTPLPAPIPLRRRFADPTARSRAAALDATRRLRDRSVRALRVGGGALTRAASHSVALVRRQSAIARARAIALGGALRTRSHVAAARSADTARELARRSTIARARAVELGGAFGGALGQQSRRAAARSAVAARGLEHALAVRIARGRSAAARAGGRLRARSAALVANARSARPRIESLANASLLPVALLLAALATVSLTPRAKQPAAVPAPAATRDVAARPPTAVEPAPAPKSRPQQAPTPVNVQINARPWARVWIDGTEVGPTPLRKVLPAGFYKLEAQFPDGRRIQREIEVAPDRRFVSLP